MLAVVKTAEKARKEAPQDRSYFSWQHGGCGE